MERAGEAVNRIPNRLQIDPMSLTHKYHLVIKDDCEEWKLCDCFAAFQLDELTGRKWGRKFEPHGSRFNTGSIL